MTPLRRPFTDADSPVLAELRQFAGLLARPKDTAVRRRLRWRRREPNRIATLPGAGKRSSRETQTTARPQLAGEGAIKCRRERERGKIRPGIQLRGRCAMDETQIKKNQDFL